MTEAPPPRPSVEQYVRDQEHAVAEMLALLEEWAALLKALHLVETTVYKPHG